MRHELKKKKEPTRFYILMTMFTVICPLPPHPSSIFSVECTNSDLFEGLSVCFYSPLQGPSAPHVGLYSLQRQSLAKGVRVLQQGHSIPQLRTVKKKKKSDFPPCLISTENQKNVPYLYRFVSFFLLEPLGNSDLIWAARRHSSSKQ